MFREFSNPRKIQNTDWIEVPHFRPYAQLSETASRNIGKNCTFPRECTCTCKTLLIYMLFRYRILFNIQDDLKPSFTFKMFIVGASRFRARTMCSAVLAGF